MSGGKGHLFGGFIFMLIFLHTITHYFFRPDFLDLVLYMAIGLMFSVWPDVDIKSIGQKFFYTVFFLVDIFLIYHEEYKIGSYFGLIIILPILAKHRGWTHSIPAMFLVPAPIILYPIYMSKSFDFSGAPFYACAVTGYFSHLVLDRKIRLIF
tara:strand:- start:5945 stop:6403 length:459 start_codon:yes stop_codon:yes gene_type:complete